MVLLVCRWLSSASAVSECAHNVKVLPIDTHNADGVQAAAQPGNLTCCLPVLQEQAAKAADVAAEVEQEAASLRAASTSAQEDSLAAAAALARLGEDLRKSEVSCTAPPQRACDFRFLQHMCA